MLGLWDFSVWSFILQIAILFALILIGNVLRRKISFFKKSLIPTAVFAGFLGLGLKYLLEALKINIISNQTMEMLTYHALALGFISLTLKNTATNDSKKERAMAWSSGLILVGGYIIQAIVGVSLTIFLAATFSKGLFPASGLLLPLGYGQGPGQAFNFGMTYESYGFAGGADFGLSIAAIGFLFACVGGVIYLNFLVRRGKVVAPSGERRILTTVEEIDSPNEIPVSESVDKITVQLAFVFFAYLLTYFFMGSIHWLVNTGKLGEFGTKTLLPLVFGFNYLFGTIFAVLIKKTCGYLKNKKIMTRDYSNNFLLNRLSGFWFDIMIVAGVCAIEIEALNSLWLPLAIICTVGGFATFFYLHFVCKKIFPDFAMQHTITMYGMLTGTTSTGMILLRELDPDFKSPSARLVISHVIPAAILGFPMLTIVGLAPKGGFDLNATSLWISVGVIFIYFAGVHLALFRKFIFKGRKS